MRQFTMRSIIATYNDMENMCNVIIIALQVLLTGS